MICFSVIHSSNYSLPKMNCKTCKKKFHSACLVSVASNVLSYNSLANNNLYVPPTNSHYRRLLPVHYMCSYRNRFLIIEPASVRTPSFITPIYYHYKNHFFRTLFLIFFTGSIIRTILCLLYMHACVLPCTYVYHFTHTSHLKLSRYSAIYIPIFPCHLSCIDCYFFYCSTSGSTQATRAAVPCVGTFSKTFLLYSQL